MIYLTTGGNGAGKTLLTLADVRAQQLKENRPVYFNGFTPKQILLDWGWKPFDPKLWQDLPDGSICVMDECQNEFPAKVQGALPDYISAVAQFRRKRGFDFWMITPHPMMIHSDIRRLIEAPSWHRHIKRPGSGTLASVLLFNHADTQCEKPGSGGRGQVSMRPYPKEVYEWYTSTVQDTTKRRIPRQVFVLFGAIALVPVLAWFAWDSLSSIGQSRVDPNAPAAGFTAPGSSQGLRQPIDTVEGYLESFRPRLADFPSTAPRYDEVTSPVTAPYPAACLSTKTDCRCFTQQATALPVSEPVCRQIVAGGYFLDWDTTGGKTPAGPTGPVIDGPKASELPGPVMETVSVQDGHVLAGMRPARYPDR